MGDKHGATVFVTSNGSRDIFPKKSASIFTNYLKSPIILDETVNYEVQLASIHCPAYENILLKNDFEESYISYNIGQLLYDSSKQKYIINERLSKELLRLAPNKSFEGIFSHDHPAAKFNHDSPSNDHSRDLTGKPVYRAQKENFMRELSFSLKLKNDATAQLQTQILLILKVVA